MTEYNTGPNIYIIGFMGVGKSSVGRRVASTLKMSFIDSDQSIEQKEGSPIADFFKLKGEDYFRKLEKEFIVEGHPASGCVVACGGGMVSVPGMMDVLLEKGVVITLSARLETILKRVMHRNTRPLLNVNNKEQAVRDLLLKREKIYQGSGNVVITDGRPVHEIVKHVIRIYKDKVRLKGSVCS